MALSADRYSLYATSTGATIECEECGWTNHLEYDFADDRTLATFDTIQDIEYEHDVTHRNGR